MTWLLPQGDRQHAPGPNCPTKGLSALMWAGVHEMEMELSHFTWSRRDWMWVILRLFTLGQVEPVAKSLTR